MVRNVIRFINPYKAGKSPSDIAAMYGIPEGDVVKLGSNENPYPPSEDVKEAYIRALSGVNRYPHPDYGELKREIAGYTGVDEECISAGNGASEVLRTICDITLEPFDRVIIPVPGYSLYAMLAMVRDARIEFIEAPEYKIDAELVESLDVQDAKIVFLCSPNNPTGNIIPGEEIKRIAKKCNGIVVVDEVYAEFTGKSCIELTKKYSNLIVVRSFSKFFGLAGLRVGYAVGNPEIVSAMEKCRLPFNISIAAAMAAIAAINSIDYYMEVRNKIVKERKRLAKELKRIGFFVYPSEANFILIKSDKEICSELEKKGIIVRDVTGFIGLSGFHARITVGLPEENSRLIQAMATISQC